ncbi:MAG: aminofutalosine synthase MqnE [Planctomycetaceae bacterium]|jgi:aminodeoxyfutalosine synthase|nr:aminofutalosine synthase MqnE [Planctomycetaceae bacterium]
MRARDLTKLADIEQKAMDGQPLDFADGMLLFDEHTDLEWVAEIADHLRDRLHGDRVYYNVNAHINPTNYCRLRCPLCAFSCDLDTAKGYLLDDAEILARAKNAAEQHASEIHIVSGIHPKKPYSWYRHILEIIHANYPALQLKAWTAVEIATFAEETGRSVADVLRDLISVGLSGLPGGGAEIFDPAVRYKIAPKKISAEHWLHVHRTAHEIGLSTNATMLFGHIEKQAHRVDHLLRLRDLQAESIRKNCKGRFEAFVPLLFHPSGTQFSDLPTLPTAERLRTVAVSRILLNNIPHIKAYWVSLGIETAKIALRFGANDFDGTVREERIHHDAGAKTPTGLNAAQLRQFILDAKRTPIERDSHYSVFAEK